MAVHDWTRVPAGIFHAFHQHWLIDISDVLNASVLPSDYYALPEQHAGSFGPDVLTLQHEVEGDDESTDESAAGNVAGGLGVALAAPRQSAIAETDLDFYRRKAVSIVVRHVSDDRMVAMIELVSPGNKSSRSRLRAFIDKVCDRLDSGVHFLVLDVLPPGRRDPQGIHGVIWDEISGQEYHAPPERPLTFASYEADQTVRAFVESLAVGDGLPEMPLFLKPNGCVQVPLDETYRKAFAAMPKRWRDVLEMK